MTMKRIAFPAAILALFFGVLVSVIAQDAPSRGNAGAQPASAPAEAKAVICFESRKGATEVTQKELKPGLPNVKCSPTTGAVLWYGDPFDGTVPMGKMPLLDKLPDGQAVVNRAPRSSTCWRSAARPVTTAPIPRASRPDNKPVPIPTMDAMFPTPRTCSTAAAASGAWTATTRPSATSWSTTSVSPISFDQPQLLCGKCHGDKLRDWRDGIHGKRIGDFTTRARSAGSPAPNATTPTMCRTASATRASCSFSRSRRPNCPRA
jgi:hypothetical protein